MDVSTACPGCFEDKGRGAVCSHCHYDEGESRSSIFLGFRTPLAGGKYVVGRHLGAGGFGITYLAWDTTLEIRVAIKEYLPRDLVGRDAGGTSVETHGREEKQAFLQGIEDFLDEARRVASLDHLCIVKVREFFRDNGTAYMVMDHYTGCTLSDYVRTRGRLSEEAAMGFMMPILDGLRTEVHRQGYFHRDISPQNIMVKGGPPILIDFGAARLALRERSRSLTVQFKPGFAPLEQYQRRGRLDARVDVYACAAVLYWMVTGTAPPEAIDRIGDDELQPPERLARGLSKRFCRATMAGLAVHAEDRPQTIEALQQLLAAPAKPASAKPASAQAPARRWSRAALPAALALILAALAGFAWQSGWLDGLRPTPAVEVVKPEPLDQIPPFVTRPGEPKPAPGLYLHSPVEEGHEIRATLFEGVRGQAEDGQPSSFQDLKARRPLCFYRSLAASDRLRWEDVGFCDRLDR